MAASPPAPQSITALNNVLRTSRTMFTGQGWRTPNALVTPGASAICAIYEKIVVSDEYWTTGHRFLFANWYLTNSVTNAESDNTSSLVIDGATLIYTDITGTVRTVALTFAGSASLSLTAGGATPHMWSDPLGILMPPNTPYKIRTHRTVASATDKVAAGSNGGIGYRQQIGERVEVSATSLTAKLTAGGISNSIPSGNNVYVYGPIAGVAQGWDGRPVSLVIGTSIEYGQGEGRYASDAFGELGPIGRGLASKAGGAPRLPNLNWSVPGASLRGIVGVGANQGLSRRIAAIQALGLTALPFTSVLCSLGTNDTTATVATWIGYFSATHAVLKQAWPVPLMQTVMYPRTTSTDAFQTTANQVPYTNTGGTGGTFAFPNGAAWICNNMIRAGQPGDYVDTVLDFTPQWSNTGAGGIAGTLRVDQADQWTGTLGAAISGTVYNITTDSPPPPGAVLALTTDNPETLLSVNSVLVTSTSYTTATTFGNVSNHATGGAIKLARSYDGTHPGGMLAQSIADTGVAPAKLAGLIL